MEALRITEEKLEFGLSVGFDLDYFCENLFQSSCIYGLTQYFVCIFYRFTVVYFINLLTLLISEPL